MDWVGGNPLRIASSQLCSLGVEYLTATNSDGSVGRRSSLIEHGARCDVRSGDHLRSAADGHAISGFAVNRHRLFDAFWHVLRPTSSRYQLH